MLNIFITGANRGLGLELTKQYLSDGNSVIAACRNPFHAEELNELKKKYPETLCIEGLDLNDDLSIKSLISDLKDKPIDILFNNAGVYGGNDQSLGSMNYKNWLNCFQVNVLAPFKIVEGLLPNIEAGQVKKIINITSKMGSIDDNSSGGYYIYRSSKTALNSITKSLAQDLKAKGITVIAVHPGWVLTDMGGPNALITPAESISSIKETVKNLELKDSGRFLDYKGNEIAW